MILWYLVMLLSSRCRVMIWCSGHSAGEGMKLSLLWVMERNWRFPDNMTGHHYQSSAQRGPSYPPGLWRPPCQWRWSCCSPGTERSAEAGPQTPRPPAWSAGCGSWRECPTCPFLRKVRFVLTFQLEKTKSMIIHTFKCSLVQHRYFVVRKVELIQVF